MELATSDAIAGGGVMAEGDHYRTNRCICGGKNHGAGRKKAEANTREMFDEWLERYGVEFDRADVPALKEEPEQPKLF